MYYFLKDMLKITQGLKKYYKTFEFCVKLLKNAKIINFVLGVVESYRLVSYHAWTF